MKETALYHSKVPVVETVPELSLPEMCPTLTSTMCPGHTKWPNIVAITDHVMRLQPNAQASSYPETFGGHSMDFTVTATNAATTFTAKKKKWLMYILGLFTLSACFTCFSLALSLHPHRKQI